MRSVSSTKTVTFIIILHFSITSCRPLLSHPRAGVKRQYPANSYNRSHEFERAVQSIFEDAYPDRDSSLTAPGRGMKRESGNTVQRVKPRSQGGKTALKRGLELGIQVNLPTTQGYNTNLERLEEMLAQALAHRFVEEKFGNSSDCPSCEEEVILYSIKPAYICDDWDSMHRVCILERNIGDTVTFYLSTGERVKARHPNVTWKKEFHMRDTRERVEFVIEPENPPENIIIGKRGYELRISPITETDIAYNMFSATLQSHGKTHAMSKVYFMIRIVPIDLGFVYVGETIELNLRKFVSIPEQSMSFRWYMEKDSEHGTLPSNMKVSITGSSIKISELRQEQEGILACSVYTNLRILATKKRFLIKDLARNKDVLQSSPNHSMPFEDEFRKKRDPKKAFPMLNSFSHSRQRRDKTPNDQIEEVILDATAADEDPTLGFSKEFRDKQYSKMLMPVLSSLGHSRRKREKDLAEEIEEVLSEPATTDKGYPLGFKRNKQNSKMLTSVLSSLRHSRHKRDTDLAEEIEEALLEPTTTEKDIPSYTTIEASTQNYDYQLELQQLRSRDEPHFVEDNDNAFQEISDSVNDFERLPETKQIGSSVGQGRMGNRRPMNTGLYFRADVPYDNSNAPVMSEDDYVFSKNRHRPVNKMSGIQKNNQKQMSSQKKPLQSGTQTDLDNRAKMRKPGRKDGYSDIVLNFDRSTVPRQVTAEEKIAKLVSNCISDFECSVTATCVRTSLKKPGYCKCLPGANGVGIFCREEIWLSNSNFDMEEHSADYMGSVL